jgi:iron complex outermembrane receptor protein
VRACPQWCARLILCFAFCLAHDPVVAARTVIEDLYPIDIPAGSLHDALLMLGQQTKNSLMFERESVQTAPVTALKGRFTLGQALDRLIADRCLEYEFIRERFVAITPGCKTANLTTPVVASAPPDELPPPTVEEILVRERMLTGSRVRNAAVGETMPLDVIDRTEIRLSGYQSIGELLRYVPAVSGNSTSTLISNGGDGTSTVTLRGLPASNTLVLLNGRRLNSDAINGESVDLNTLPLAMVERVEILKDGVSAIYGSEAVAGVVNVITRTDTHGWQMDAYVGQSGDGDLTTQNFSLLFGDGADAWSISGGVNYYEQSGIKSRDRRLSRSSDDRGRGGIDKRSSATAPARILLDTDALILRDGADGTAPGDFRPASSEDRFEFRRYTSSIVPSSRISGFLATDFTVAESWQGYMEALITLTEAENRLAPAPLFTAFESVPLIVDADQTFNPFGVDISDVRRRIIELPAREQQNETTSYRSVVGVRSRKQSFNLDAALQFSMTRAKETSTNGLNGLLLGNALSVDCVAPCVPINLFGPPGSITSQMLDYVATSAELEGTSKLFAATLDADWIVGRTAAGVIELSAGLELRHESLRTYPEAVLAQSRFVGGVNRTRISGRRDIWETYGELFLPLAKDQWYAELLNVQIAARVSRYSDFGYQVSPRLVINWSPAGGFTWRTSAARGFRAPSLLQLYGSQQQSFEQLNDPCSIAANVAAFSGCTMVSDPTLTQFQVINGGDENLDPERSLTVSTGLLWQYDWRSTALEASVDWYHIRQRDVVESSGQYIVNRNARTGGFSDRVSRNAEGNIDQVLATLQNIGQRRTTGLDFTLSLAKTLPELGAVNLAINGTQIREFKDKFDPDSPSVDQSGTFLDEASGGLGALPNWKWNVGLSWQSTQWQAHYNFYRVSSLKEVVPIVLRKRRIRSWATHNFNVSYLGPLTQWVRVTVGANNLLNTAPPFSAAAFNDSYDARTYDITGRYLFVKLDRSF